MVSALNARSECHRPTRTVGATLPQPGSAANCVGKLRNVAEVGTATAAENVEPRHPPDQNPVLHGKLNRVAIVEGLAFIEFGMTEARCIAAKPAHPSHPVRVVEYIEEMIRVRTIDHKVGGTRFRCRIDGANRLRQGLTGRQRTIGFDRERDHGRQSRRPRGTYNTDGLRRLGKRQRGNHVDLGVREPPDLLGVIVLGFIRGDIGLRRIGIAARTDHAVQDNLPAVSTVLVAQRCDESDGFPIGGFQLRIRGAQISAPMRMRFPGLAVQHEPRVEIRRQSQKFAKIIRQSLSPRGIGQQRVGRKLGDFNAVVKYQVGLEAGIGQKTFPSSCGSALRNLINGLPPVANRCIDAMTSVPWRNLPAMRRLLLRCANLQRKTANGTGHHDASAPTVCARVNSGPGHTRRYKSLFF